MQIVLQKKRSLPILNFRIKKENNKREREYQRKMKQRERERRVSIWKKVELFSQCRIETLSTRGLSLVQE